MLTYTIFKVGDKVTVINDLNMWSYREKPEITFTVVRVLSQQYERDGHAYEEECDRQHCLHSCSHPQLLRVRDKDDVEIDASGYWFDPIVKDRNAKLKEKQDAL